MLNELRNANVALLDGYPRTVAQAEALEDHCDLHTVIYLNIPFPIIVDRLKKRWTHLPSGRVYNLDFNPPKKHGIDDVTGEPLVQREDDKPETVTRRLKEFEDKTSPVLDFYKDRKIVNEFAGETTNEIWPHILRHLQDTVPGDLHRKDGTGGEKKDKHKN